MTDTSAKHQHRLMAIGQEIFARARRAEPSPVSMAWWQQQMLEAIMSDEPLKIQLFRFIESLPRLRGPRAIAAHLKEYLSDRPANGGTMGSVADLVTSYRSDRSLMARTVAFAAHFGAATMAKTFIIGSNPREAIASVRRLRRQRLAFTMDMLGESVICSQDADHTQAVYLELIDAMAAAAPAWQPDALLDDAPFGAIPRVNISIKLSALTPKFDPIAPQRVSDTVVERLRPILRAARRHGAFINVDTEHYAVKDLTFDIVMRIASEPEFRDWPDLGIVIQAYLRDSEADTRRILGWVVRRGTPITVRLVKGAYWDQETAQACLRRWPIPVWTEKWQSDYQYERLSTLLLKNYQWLRPAFASHNVRSIASALATADELGVPPGTAEVQMLYGMGDPLKSALVDMGQRVRIYAPFGELMPGMAYFMRRLLENTANESFLRQSFSENLPIERLLAPPARAPAAPPVNLPHFSADGPDEDESMHVFENEPETDFAMPANRARMSEAIKAARATPLRVAGEHSIGEYECRNPSQPSEVLARIALTPESHVADVVAAAQSAWREWSATPARQRATLLSTVAGRMRTARWDFVARLVLELGKTWRDADAEVTSAIDAVEYAAREIVRLSERPRRRDVPGETNTYTYLSRGVAAVLTPYGQPLATPAHFVASALAAGSSVVFKPGRAASAIAARWLKLFEEAGLPQGVLTAAYGDAGVGEALAAHPSISLIAFAGRRSAAARISEIAGRMGTGHVAMKRRLMFTTGVSSVIIDDDTDIDEAVLGAMACAFTFAGQSAATCARAIVVGDAYAHFVERLTAAAGEVGVGPAEDSGTTIGPLIDDEALQAARRHADDARKSGRCVVERQHADLIRRTGGHYFGPAVFVDVRPDAPIAHAELAAPILLVTPAVDLKHAVAIANDTAYPLSAVFYSRSPGHIAAVRDKLRAASVFINRKVAGGVPDRQPAGGFGLAGSGHPMGGPDFLRDFLDARTVSENVIRHGLVATADSSTELAHAQ